MKTLSRKELVKPLIAALETCREEWPDFEWAFGGHDGADEQLLSDRRAEEDGEEGIYIRVRGFEFEGRIFQDGAGAIIQLMMLMPGDTLIAFEPSELDSICAQLYNARDLHRAIQLLVTHFGLLLEGGYNQAA